MRTRITILFLIAMTGIVQAAEPVVKLPAEVKAQPGRPVRLQAETEGKLIRWASASEGVDLIPFPDGKVAIFSAPAPGRYRILAWTAAGDVPSEAAICIVVVEGQTPPTPVPPGPTPPPPPGPAPPLPDSFRQTLQAAYDAEPDPAKAQLKASLATLYRQSVDAARRGDIETWGQLFEVMSSAARFYGVSGKLKGVQGVIQSELQKTLPRSRNAQLDGPGRDLASRTFQRVADALEALR